MGGGPPLGHRTHAEMGCDPRQHESKAVSLQIALALKGWRGTVGSLGLSCLDLGDESGTGSRSWLPERAPAPLVSQLPFFPNRQIPWLSSFSELLLSPLRHRLGLSPSSCEWAYQIPLWVPRAQEPLTAQKGRHQNTASHISPTSTCPSELEPDPLPWAWGV